MSGVRSSQHPPVNVPEWEFSRLEYLPVTQGVAGSSPVHSAIFDNAGRAHCDSVPFLVYAYTMPGVGAGDDHLCVVSFWSWVCLSFLLVFFRVCVLGWFV